MALGKGKAGYLTPGAAYLTKPTSPKHSFFTSVFLLFVLLFGLVGGTLSSLVSVAHADVNITDGSGDYIQDAKTPDGFFNALTKSEGEANQGLFLTPAGRNTFGYVLQRMFTVDYLNTTPEDSKNGPDEQCNTNAQGAGTALYHNCDVPNFLTEMLQNIASTFVPTGPINAEVSEAKVNNGFGIPSTLPGVKGEVPVNPADRSVKYTALELFGYNLKYTSYKGEWDHIEVMTSARMLSDFSFMDKVTLGAKAIVNGVVGGVTQGTSNFANKVTEGDLLGAVGGFFSGLYGGGASASINTILDTSDANVFATYGWYRVGYGGTLYNARELSKEELSAFMQAFFQKLFQPDLKKATVPPELTAISAGPPKPIEAKSSCTVTILAADGTSSQQEITPSAAPPGGLSAQECKDLASVAPYNDLNPIWDVDGTVQAETLISWTEHYKDILSTGVKYGITCTMATDEVSRDANITNFYACWASQYGPATVKAQIAEQEKLNNQWYSDKLLPENIAAVLAENKDLNFNAPWSRYVCTDSKGADLKDGDGYVFLFTSDLKLNPVCSPVRPPIQNGYFGNGYDIPSKAGIETQPQTDTRRAAVPENTFLSMMAPDPSILANVGLFISSFNTKITNTLLDLAFAPVLQNLGIADKFVTLIEGFRDSLYYPFIIIVVAVGGLTVIINAGRKKEYAKGFKDILLMMAVFFIGVILLQAPRNILTVVDEVPSKIETAMAGAIFSAGFQGDENICSASSFATGTVEGLNGTPIAYSSSAAVRTMECEMWRAFVFTPWVEGQWGTTYTNLYSAQSGMPNTLKNKNESLVGDAAVNMGGGTIVKNWALYQLDVLSSGTATTSDPTDATGSIPRDFYRIIDAQAGPNNAALSDDTYFTSWSGQDVGHRVLVGVTSAIVSGFGVIVTSVYAFFKIQITLLTALMLLFLPAILLMGLHPTWGRTQLKKYTGTIVVLMIQRVFLVVFLAVMIKMLVAVASSSGNYLVTSFIMMGVCGLFLSYRKEFLNLITSSADRYFGGIMGSSLVNNPSAGMQRMLPRSVASTMAIGKAGAAGIAGGAIGGYLAGGLSEARSGASKGAEIAAHRVRNQQRRKGLGAFSKGFDAAQAGKRAAREALIPLDKERTAKAITVQGEINERRKKQPTADGSVGKRPISVGNNAVHQENLDKLMTLEKKLAAAKGKALRARPSMGPQAANPDLNALGKAMDNVRASNEGAAKRKIRLLEEERRVLLRQIEIDADPTSTFEEWEVAYRNERFTSTINEKGEEVFIRRELENVEKAKSDLDRMKYELDEMRANLGTSTNLLADVAKETAAQTVKKVLQTPAAEQKPSKKVGSWTAEEERRLEKEAKELAEVQEERARMLAARAASAEKGGS
jgi:hypothetical protein